MYVRVCVCVRVWGACVLAQALVCLCKTDVENSRSPTVTVAAAQTRKCLTASARAFPPHRNHSFARDWRHARTRVGWPRVTRGSPL